VDLGLLISLNIPVVGLVGLGAVIVVVITVGEEHEGVVVGLDEEADKPEVIQVQVIGDLGVGLSHIGVVVGLIGVADVGLGVHGAIAGHGLIVLVDTLLVHGLG